jgi:glycine/D-amino acid oxidase-like deaminating enzyme
MGPAMRASQGKRMKTDVLIVGGGLAGSATAYYLAREGVAVTLIERGSLNGRASGANAGSIHVQIPYPEYVELGPGWARGFAPVLPMMRDSVAMWAGLGKELGTDLEVALTGGLLVAETEAQLRIVAEKAALERAHGIETRMLGRDELRALAPYVSPRMIGAAFCEGEGKANPLKAGPAFAAAARRLGATILPDTPLLALAKDRAGYCGQTSAGPIHARRVVNAAGAEAAAIGRMLGLELAIDGFPLQVSVTEPVAPLVGHLLYSAAGKLTLKQRANGTCLIGGGWPSRRRGDGSLALNPASFAANLATATATVPALAGARIARSWPAIVNGTADWRPLLGEAPGHPGFFLQLFPWMGFTAGPIAARVIADLVLGRKPPVELARISALA